VPRKNKQQAAASIDDVWLTPDDQIHVNVWIEGDFDEARGAHDLTLFLAYAREHGFLELKKVTVEFVGDRGGITTEDLRRVQFGNLQREITRRIREQDPTSWNPGDPSAYAQLPPSDWIKALKRAPRPGRGGRGDLFYASCAREYVELLTEPKPVQALAARRHLSESQIRNILHQARERGLLTKLGRGRAGGELTDKAKELLNGPH
jgi:hypothetical protein